MSDVATAAVSEVRADSRPSVRAPRSLLQDECGEDREGRIRHVDDDRRGEGTVQQAGIEASLERRVGDIEDDAVDHHRGALAGKEIAGGGLDHARDQRHEGDRAGEMDHALGGVEDNDADPIERGRFVLDAGGAQAVPSEQLQHAEHRPEKEHEQELFVPPQALLRRPGARVSIVLHSPPPKIDQSELTRIS